MKIYLSGPMSGIKEFNFPEFHRIAAELRAKGHEVVSPAENVIPEYPTGYVAKDEAERIKVWQTFMRADIKSMMDCDSIAVMKGWHKSQGARVEVYLADKLGLRVIDAETLRNYGVISHMYITNRYCHSKT
jgi:nucleoside 2-deoxyribosyltransferase